MNTQPTALRLADHLECNDASQQAQNQAAAELRRLHQENEKLRSVMVAAAEEIHEHWDAHCDEEGYGPANLMHRLERGIAAEYGYQAGDFARLASANQELLEALQTVMGDASHGQNMTLPERFAQARAAIAKYGKQT